MPFYKPSVPETFQYTVAKYLEYAKPGRNATCPYRVENVLPIGYDTEPKNEGLYLLSVNNYKYAYNKTTGKLEPVKEGSFYDNFLYKLRDDQIPVLFKKDEFPSDKPLGTPISYKEFFGIDVKNSDKISLNPVKTNIRNNMKKTQQGPIYWYFWNDLDKAMMRSIHD